MKKTRRVFSENFKRDKVSLYEKGKMSVNQLSKIYDVSETALYRWIDKYRITPSSERIVVETDSDYLRLVKLEKQTVEMERLIGVQQLKLEYYKSLIAAASKEYKEDVEKKFGQVR